MLTLVTRFARLIAQLRDAIGVHAARQARARNVVWLGTQVFVEFLPPERLPPLPDAAWLLFWHRVGRLGRRFAVLHARWRANALPRRRPPRPRPLQPDTNTPHVPAPASAPPLRLPRAHGWAGLRMAGAGPATFDLHEVLNDPETQDLVAAAPQAGRLLRPLCRALGAAQPAWLALPRPPRPRFPRSSTPRPQPAPRPCWPGGKRRPTTHPFPMRPDDKPLPGSVIRAAKAWKPPPGR